MKTLFYSVLVRLIANYIKQLVNPSTPDKAHRYTQPVDVTIIAIGNLTAVFITNRGNSKGSGVFNGMDSESAAGVEGIKDSRP